MLCGVQCCPPSESSAWQVALPVCQPCTFSLLPLLTMSAESWQFRPFVFGGCLLHAGTCLTLGVPAPALVWRIAFWGVLPCGTLVLWSFLFGVNTLPFMTSSPNCFFSLNTSEFNFPSVVKLVLSFWKRKVLY